MRHREDRFKTRSVRSIAVATVMLAVAGLAAMAPADAAAFKPSMGLWAPTGDITATVYDFGGELYVDVSPGLYMRTFDRLFQVNVSRRTWRDPIKAEAFVGGAWKPIPTSELRDWYGFTDAFTLTWETSGGALIEEQTMDWCPNGGEGSRLSPTAAPTSRFTSYCGTNPFTRGQKWGIERGWATSVLGWDLAPPPLEIGTTVILTVDMRDSLADMLGVSPSGRTTEFHVNVVEGESFPFPEEEARARDAGEPPLIAADQAGPGEAAPAQPRASVSPIPASTLPDLMSLPAWGISTHEEEGLDLLDFGATVYNAGRGPLVVEGFLTSPGEMDAHQFFYRPDGTLATTRDVGGMMYDDRPSHQHWHFMDFAQYDLIDGTNTSVATSGKEAFCLAPTDSIDMLQPGAVKNPGDGDLQTACGGASSIWVREVLASGWGDTYTQYRAGQSLDITDLPNGTYRIRVISNPAGRLKEASAANNVAHRTVILGGVAGARTVEVPPHQLIDSEGGFFPF